MKTWVNRYSTSHNGSKGLKLNDEANRTVWLFVVGDSIQVEVSGEFSLGEYEISKEDLLWLLEQ